MSYKVDNAVILAAGTSSRFAPLSYEMPKALLPVRGEILIERQIQQLKEAGVPEIYIVVGYKKELFSYLEDAFDVHLVANNAYLTRNNNGSIYAVRHLLRNSYVCSADNYFAQNPFEVIVPESYYAVVHADGPTNEWCVKETADGVIQGVEIGGSDAWYMMGHTFWDEKFSRDFVRILEQEYELPQTKGLLWESIFCSHVDELKMKTRKYPANMIFEFDTLDELRTFDPSYVTNTHSAILKEVAAALGGNESELTDFEAYKSDTSEASGFCFWFRGQRYQYKYKERDLKRCRI